MMEMSPTKIGGGDGAFTGIDGGVKVEGGIGSLLVDASNACNLAPTWRKSQCPYKLQ
jgi:hypothetical protein